MKFKGKSWSIFGLQTAWVILFTVGQWWLFPLKQAELQTLTVNPARPIQSASLAVLPVFNQVKKGQTGHLDVRLDNQGARIEEIEVKLFFSEQLLKISSINFADSPCLNPEQAIIADSITVRCRTSEPKIKTQLVKLFQFEYEALNNGNAEIQILNTSLLKSSGVNILRENRNSQIVIQ